MCLPGMFGSKPSVQAAPAAPVKAEVPATVLPDADKSRQKIGLAQTIKTDDSLMKPVTSTAPMKTLLGGP